MNKSRINCFMYQDAVMTANELPIRQRTDAQIKTSLIHLNVEMNQCRLLHHVHNCQLSWNAWLEDHGGPNMAQIYAQQTESEAEADERLSGSDSEGESVQPWSSQ